MNNHIVIDLETTSHKKRGDCILSIGATLVDLDADESVEELRDLGFKETVGLNELNLRAASISTMKFWMMQGAQAVENAMTPNCEPDPDPAVDLRAALVNLKNWILSCESVSGVWGNGSDFDLVILEDAFDKFLNEGVPWHFGKIRCLRTLRNVTNMKKLPSDKAPEGIESLIAHDSLDDAVYEAVLLREIKRNFPNLSF